jgi:hypothetical protein
MCSFKKLFFLIIMFEEILSFIRCYIDYHDFLIAENVMILFFMGVSDWSMLWRRYLGVIIIDIIISIDAWALHKYRFPYISTIPHEMMHQALKKKYVSLSKDPIQIPSDSYFYYVYFFICYVFLHFFINIHPTFNELCWTFLAYNIFRKNYYYIISLVNDDHPISLYYKHHFLDERHHYAGPIPFFDIILGYSPLKYIPIPFPYIDYYLYREYITRVLTPINHDLIQKDKIK